MNAPHSLPDLMVEKIKLKVPNPDPTLAWLRCVVREPLLAFDISGGSRLLESGVAAWGHAIVLTERKLINWTWNPSEEQENARGVVQNGLGRVIPLTQIVEVASAFGYADDGTLLGAAARVFLNQIDATTSDHPGPRQRQLEFGAMVELDGALEVELTRQFIFELQARVG